MNSTSHLSDDMLNAWIDGVATDAERRIISAHLDECAVCQAELDSLLTVKRLLSELPEPALPRSFKLGPDHARKPTPIQEDTPPSTVVRLLPIVRVLSIAAVLTLLMLGGVVAFGPVNGDSETDSVTNQSSGASEETYPSRRAIAPGEVVDQGQAATSSNSAMGAMGNGSDATSPGTSNDRSALEIATLSTGILAALMAGLWILLSKRSQARPVTQNASVTGK